jgi:hypothetical protein
VLSRSVRTIVVTAREDIGYVSELAPGLKSVHLILPGFRNPPPGRDPIRVEAETGPDGRSEHGVGAVEIVAAPQPSIHVTRVFDQPPALAQRTPPARASTNEQTAAPGRAVPIPYNFLLRDDFGEPLVGVALAPAAGSPDCDVLVQGSREAGRVRVTAPPGARGQRLIADAPSAAIRSPVSLVPTARLRAQFVGGDKPGDEVATFALHGGNAARVYVRVPDRI